MILKMLKNIFFLLKINWLMRKITFSARDIQRLLPKDIDFKNSVITPTFAKPKRPLENGSSPTLKNQT